MRPLGLRGRLVATLTAVVALAVVVVGVTSVFLVDRSLRSRLAEEVIATTEFNLTVLLPAAGIGDPADPQALEAAGVIDRFLRRGTAGAWVEFEDGSRVSGGLAPVQTSPELAEIARRGEIAYEFVDVGGDQVVVSAARLPPSGPLFYFVTPAQVLADTTRQLIAVVSLAGAAAVVVGAAAIGVVSRVLTGHFSVSGLGGAAVAVHVLAAALWCGALAGLVLTVAHRGRWARVLPRFSTLSLWCVAAMVGAGAVGAVDRLGSVADLVVTGYGRVLTAKLVLTSLLVVLGWRNRTLWLPAARGHRASAALSRTRAVVELTAMGVALTLAAGLAVTG